MDAVDNTGIPDLLRSETSDTPTTLSTTMSYPNQRGPYVPDPRRHTPEDPWYRNADPVALERHATQSENLSDRNGALGNPNCPPHLVLAAASSEAVTDRVAAAKNPAPDPAREMLSATDPTVMVRAAFISQHWSARLPLPVVHAMLADESVRVRRKTFDLPNLLEALTTSDNPFTALKLEMLSAKRHEIDTPILAVLAADPDVTVRVATAHHISVRPTHQDETLIQTVLHDSAPEVRAAIVVKKSWLAEHEALHLAADPSTAVRLAVAKSNLTDYDAVFNALTADTDVRVRTAVVKNQHGHTASNTHRFTNDTAWQVRAAISRYGKLNAADTVRLAADPNWHVRAAIATHATLNPATLNTLTDDPHPKVSTAALERFVTALSAQTSKVR